MIAGPVHRMLQGPFSGELAASSSAKLNVLGLSHLFYGWCLALHGHRLGCARSKGELVANTKISRTGVECLFLWLEHDP